MTNVQSITNDQRLRLGERPAPLGALAAVIEHSSFIWGIGHWPLAVQNGVTFSQNFVNQPRFWESLTEPLLTILMLASAML